MEFEFTYGIARVVEFPLVARGSIDLIAATGFTPATGDTKISQDAGNVANTTNNPSAVGGTGSVLFTLSLTAAELQAQRVVIQIVDQSSPKIVEDQVLIGYCKDFDKLEFYAVNTSSTAASPTAFEADRAERAEEATADHFNGRLIQFVDGALQGKMTRIEDYAQQNSRGYFTVTSMGEAPANGDRFVIF